MEDVDGPVADEKMHFSAFQQAFPAEDIQINFIS